MKHHGKNKVVTVAHELVHQFGIPDIYANVGLNPSGSHADSIMDGKRSSWSLNTGLMNTNVPGVIKYYLGWIDNVVEVSESGVYTLPSFSTSPTIMVLYPHGDKQNKFVFFAEYLSASEPCIEGEDFGLRIWKHLKNRMVIRIF